MSSPMSALWRPVTPEALVRELGDRLSGQPGRIRVAVDGAPSTDPARWAELLATAVRDAGRPAVHVPAQGFWRDRSLRFEYGREDAQSYLSWLDATALRREVLDPAVTTGMYLPSLRDPATNRSTRATPVQLADSGVLIVSGALLLGLGLPFELQVHLLASRAALRRRTPTDEQWTLAAFADYTDTVDPAALADVVIKLDDPRHPAVSYARRR